MRCPRLSYESLVRALRKIHTVATFCATAVVGATVLYGLWLLVRMFLFDQFVVPSESMWPTLQPGDRIIVDKTLMGPRLYTDFDFHPEGGELHSRRLRGRRHVRRGDIVVFNYPQHGWRISFVINNVYCKRVVALPGDTLRIDDGWYRNNNGNETEDITALQVSQTMLTHLPDYPLDSATLRTIPFDDHLPWTILHFGPMYIPRRGDEMAVTPREARLYQLLLEWELGKKVEYDWDRGLAWAGGRPLTHHRWRHNYYFMAGDNVTDSYDSRYWGLVPEEYITGIVTRISYSRDRQTGEFLWDRLMKNVYDEP